MSISVHKYFHDVAMGKNDAEMPHEVLDLLLIEKFNWTPNQLYDISEHRMRELLMVMNIRKDAEDHVEKMKTIQEKNKNGTRR